jgi:hypothetical protein
MTHQERWTWERVKVATLALGVPADHDAFTRRVLSVYLESADLDELRAELAFVDDPDVRAWYRALGVDA